MFTFAQLKNIYAVSKYHTDHKAWITERNKYQAYKKEVERYENMIARLKEINEALAPNSEFEERAKIYLLGEAEDLIRCINNDEQEYEKIWKPYVEEYGNPVEPELEDYYGG